MSQPWPACTTWDPTCPEIPEIPHATGPHRTKRVQASFTVHNSWDPPSLSLGSRALSLSDLFDELDADSDGLLSEAELITCIGPYSDH